MEDGDTVQYHSQQQRLWYLERENLPIALNRHMSEHKVRIMKGIKSCTVTTCTFQSKLYQKSLTFHCCETNNNNKTDKQSKQKNLV